MFRLLRERFFCGFSRVVFRVRSSIGIIRLSVSLKQSFCLLSKIYIGLKISLEFVEICILDDLDSFSV